MKPGTCRNCWHDGKIDSMMVLNGMEIKTKTCEMCLHSEPALDMEPCSLCGGDAILEIQENNSDFRVMSGQVKCTKCHMAGPRCEYERHAVEKWNKIGAQS